MKEKDEGRDTQVNDLRINAASVQVMTQNQLSEKVKELRGVRIVDNHTSLYRIHKLEFATPN